MAACTATAVSASTPRKSLVDGKCPDHQVAPTYIEEENYFFRMSRYQQRLIDELEVHPERIQPDRYRNEVLAMLRGEALGDLCISRPKARLSWGIELPFDDRYVAYVWVDALTNYVSAIRHIRPHEFDDYWPRAEHLIGKDILNRTASSGRQCSCRPACRSTSACTCMDTGRMARARCRRASATSFAPWR
jgi:methionyl-tRNA synthetase